MSSMFFTMSSNLFTYLCFSFYCQCGTTNNQEEDLIDEIIKMMMSDGDNGEEFLEYLLSSNEDQSSNCQTLVLWKNEATIKPQPRDDDMLDESEGSVSFS